MGPLKVKKLALSALPILTWLSIVKSWANDMGWNKTETNMKAAVIFKQYFPGKNLTGWIVFFIILSPLLYFFAVKYVYSKKHAKKDIM